MMKIAVPSNDGKTISQHFGRSACFIVFETDNGEVKGREVRTNSFTPHARGECNLEGHDGNHSHGHSHSAIISALQDCDYVLCLGMGWRATEDLRCNGIEPFILDRTYTPEQAVSLFLQGAIASTGMSCRCHG